MQKLTTVGKFDQKKRNPCWNALTELLREMRRQNEERKWNRQHAHGEGRGGFRLLSNRLQNETLESSAIVLASDFFAMFAAISLENFLCRSRFWIAETKRLKVSNRNRDASGTAGAALARRVRL